MMVEQNDATVGSHGGSGHRQKLTQQVETENLSDLKKHSEMIPHHQR